MGVYYMRDAILETGHTNIKMNMCVCECVGVCVYVCVYSYWFMV